MKLPARPLLAVFERTARQQGYIGTDVRGGERYPGLMAFADVIGIGRRAIERARADGVVDLTTADRVAIALGLHPILVWPGEYELWLGCEPPPGTSDHDRRRDQQRHHQRERGVA
jgi:hypothetical protein